MRAFNKSVSARVIAADADMFDMVTLGKIRKGLEERGAVVGYDFAKGTPTT